jgi:hypothetical protein
LRSFLLVDMHYVTLSRKIRDNIGSIEEWRTISVTSNRFIPQTVPYFVIFVWKTSQDVICATMKHETNIAWD